MSKVGPTDGMSNVGGSIEQTDNNNDQSEAVPLPPPPPANIFKGYENVGLDAEISMPAPIYEPAPVVNAPRPDFQTVSILTEDEARTILIEYANQKCCYGVKPAKELTFTDIQSSNSYRYLLKSFYETRATQWVFAPFRGEPLMNNGQAPPDSWSIQVQPSGLFVKEVQKLEIPNTANIKICHTCTGMGTVICSMCYGRGRRRCTWCFGSGWRTHTSHRNGHSHTHRSRCSSCFGSGLVSCLTCGATGRVLCPSCRGARQLKWYIQLTVKFDILENDFLQKSENIPDEKLRTCQGVTTFQEQLPRVQPITHHHEILINKSSADLIQVHSNQLSNGRILMQLQLVVAIPVTLCKYKYGNKDYEYNIYGNEKKVHETKYAASCCWCC